MIRTILRVARVPLLVLAVALGCGPAGVFADDSSTQHWKGVVTLPGGMKLDFTVNLGPDGGRISIPMQGARDLPLRNGAADGNSLKFTLAAPGAPENAWAKFDMTVSDDGAQAEGTLSQAGQQFPVSMTRLTAEQAAATELKRPQTPVPPLPYEERAVEFKSEAGGVTIAGTLTVPVGDGPHPAVVLITGSGAQDR
ncbi:MAG: hypothetical protein JNK58_06695, partial [Phycisphaerae bacterium]|nr:hypothetical protein [Phycisphaerae bacterium]